LVDFLVDFELGDSLVLSLFSVVEDSVAASGFDVSVFVAFSVFLEVASSLFFLDGEAALEVEALLDGFGDEAAGAVLAAVAAGVLATGFAVALTAGGTDAAALGEAAGRGVANGLAVGAAVALVVAAVVLVVPVDMFTSALKRGAVTP
jgi:hypothetical protein